MAGMNETANAELDGIREALMQAEATEQYLAARQEEIANALLAVAGASAAMPSLESLLLSQDQDAITKALLGAVGGGAPAVPQLPGLGAPAPEMDEQTKALLAALGGAPPPLPGVPPAGVPDLGALLAAATGAAGAVGPGAPAAGAGGLEALLAAAAAGGAAGSPEALLLAAAGAGGPGPGTGPAPSSTTPAPAAAPAPAEPAGDEGLDEMTKALLAAAGIDANAAGSDDVTQALLAAAVSNPAIVASAADGKEDDITKALLSAAQTKKGGGEDDGSAPGGGSGSGAAGSSSAARKRDGEKSAPASEKKKKAEKPAGGDSGDKAKEADSLADLAAAGNVPEEMTKALLAAVATNTPSAAGDADRIIKAVLRAATASMSESSEPAPVASRSQDKKESKAPELPKEPAVPAPQAKAAMPAFEFITKKEDAKPARPQGSMVSTEFLRAMEENAKASARTSAAKGGVKPPAVSFSLGPAAKKLKAADKLEDDEQERLNQQLLEQAEATKAWVFFGKIPKGTSEGLIRTECAKYGTVTSILYNAEPDSLFEEPWALVSLASLESAAKAVDRLNSRLTLFGGTQQVEVRMGTPEDIAKWEDLIKAEQQFQMQHPPPPMPVPMMAPALMAPPQGQEMQLVAAGGLDPSQARRHGGRRKRDGSADSRGSDRGKRRRSDSRSPSRDPPPLPVVQRKVYGLGGFDNASVDGDKKTPRAMAAEASLVMAPSGDRRIGTRGSWAEFVTREWEYYYVNIHTGEKRWMLPVAEMRGVAPRRSN